MLNLIWPRTAWNPDFMQLFLREGILADGSETSETEKHLLKVAQVGKMSVSISNWEKKKDGCGKVVACSQSGHAICM